MNQNGSVRSLQSEGDDKPFLFDMDTNYSQLLSGAHRKPAVPIGTPALICHLALWQPSDDKNWIKHIDVYLQGIFIQIRNMPALTSPNIYIKEISKYLLLLNSAIEWETGKFVDKSLPEFQSLNAVFNSANQAIIFDFNWENQRVVIRFEKHVEYIQFSFVIDLSTKRSDDDRKGDNEGEGVFYKEICGDLQNLDSLLEPRRSKIDRLNDGTRVPATDEEKKRFSEIHQNLYERVWERFFRDIMLPIGSVHSMDGNYGIIESNAGTTPSNLGQVFADFRGIVLNKASADSVSVPEGRFFNLPGWFSARPRWPRKTDNLFSEDDANVITRSLWPFLTSEKRLNLNRYEFTVSRMLSERAIYITALGAQPSPYTSSNRQRGAEQLPVYYLAFVSTNSQWQIGRLIEKINHLGTVRIAAIQDYDKMRVKSDVLRGLSGPIDRYVGMLAANKFIDEVALTNETSQALGEIANWNAEFKGGITYRIERSRYYVRQFRDGLSTLTIKNVAGYQPYDYFVEHRLGAIYDFIDRLGIRLNNFERRLALIYQAISTRQQLISVKQATANSKAVAELSFWAEILFVGVAAPYYGIGVIEHLDASVAAMAGANTESTTNNILLLSMYLLILSITTSRVIYKVITKSKEPASS